MSTSLSLGRKVIICTTLMALQFGSLSPAFAELAQKPLIASTGSRPAPNVMLTMDTSGSMNFRHMPEGSTKVNGETIAVESGRTWRVHPDDTYADGVQTAGHMPAKKNETDDAKLLRQIKLRSPDINTIYYDPKQRYTPWASGPSTHYPEASFTKAYINPLKQGSGDKSIDLSVKYVETERVCVEGPKWNCQKYEDRIVTEVWPGLYYLLRAGANPGVTSNYDMYDVNDAASRTFTRYPNRTDCAADPCTQAEERKNFANWFVYYRFRMLLAKAALSEAFHNRDNNVRVGWTTIKFASQIGNRFSINNTTGPAYPKNAGDPWGPIQSPIKPLTAANRQALLTSIQEWEAEGSTPLRIALDQVGKYFMNTSAHSPWHDDPVAGGGNQASCRRSVNILTTDGYYNDTIDLNEYKDYASQIGADDLVGDLDQKLERPYRDKASATATGYSNTLADFAYKYWKTDLQPTTADNPGIPDNVDIKGKDTATWQHLTQFTMGIGVSGFYDSSNPDAVGSDFYKLTNDPNTSWQDPASSDPAKTDDLWHAAVNSRGDFYSVKDAQSLSAAVTKILDDTTKASRSEAGVALASTSFQVDNFKYVPSYTTVDWIGELSAYKLDIAGKQVTDTPAWKASSAMPAPNARSLWIWNPDSGTTSEFRWNTMGATNRGNLTQSTEDLVNYLRGDKSKEGPGTATRPFRPREGSLPDFINSSPAVLKYSGSSLIFMGGNGGYLHAFSSVDGREVFGFVPRGVLPNLHLLSKQNYDHRYFVDGPIALGNADIVTTSNNQTVTTTPRAVLVGALGAGGKGVYALNVTNASAAGQPVVMWDHTASTSNDIGHIFSLPEIGQLPNGAWKVFVGNGVDSTNGSAALLVIDVATGTIDTVTVNGGAANGLGGVKLVRKNGKVLAAYAGDLNGNLWRFDYNAADGGKMVAGYGGQPLFTAVNGTTRQPITATPAVFYMPRSPRLLNGGNLILFGTGKLLTEADRTDASVQSVYGVLDKIPETTSSSGETPPSITRDVMDQVKVTESTAAGFFDVIPAKAAVAPDRWMGWFMDLIIPGATTTASQRLIYPVTALKDFALLTTLAPANAAAECGTDSGKGYVFLLPARSGEQHSLPVLDTNGDGLIDGSDLPSAGLATAPGPQTVITDGTDGFLETPTPIPPPIHLYCLIDCTIIDRVWKRLINVPQPSAAASTPAATP